MTPPDPPPPSDASPDGEPPYDGSNGRSMPSAEQAKAIAEAAEAAEKQAAIRRSLDAERAAVERAEAQLHAQKQSLQAEYDEKARQLQDRIAAREAELVEQRQRVESAREHANAMAEHAREMLQQVAVEQHKLATNAQSLASGQMPALAASTAAVPAPSADGPTALHRFAFRWRSMPALPRWVVLILLTVSAGLAGYAVASALMPESMQAVVELPIEPTDRDPAEVAAWHAAALVAQFVDRPQTNAGPIRSTHLSGQSPFLEAVTLQLQPTHDGAAAALRVTLTSTNENALLAAEADVRALLADYRRWYLATAEMPPPTSNEPPAELTHWRAGRDAAQSALSQARARLGALDIRVQEAQAAAQAARADVREQLADQQTGRARLMTAWADFAELLADRPDVLPDSAELQAAIAQDASVRQMSDLLADLERQYRVSLSRGFLSLPGPTKRVQEALDRFAGELVGMQDADLPTDIALALEKLTDLQADWQLAHTAFRRSINDVEQSMTDLADGGPPSMDALQQRIDSAIDAYETTRSTIVEDIRTQLEALTAAPTDQQLRFNIGSRLNSRVTRLESAQAELDRALAGIQPDGVTANFQLREIIRLAELRRIDLQRARANVAARIERQREQDFVANREQILSDANEKLRGLAVDLAERASAIPQALQVAAESEAAFARVAAERDALRGRLDHLRQQLDAWQIAEPTARPQAAVGPAPDALGEPITLREPQPTTASLQRRTDAQLVGGIGAAAIVLIVGVVLGRFWRALAQPPAPRPATL